jgi:hypothetical protein
MVKRILEPRQGRQNVAHGESRGSPVRPLPPSPLPRRAGEGEEKGVGAALPRACALGYYLPPLPGLVGLTSRITGMRDYRGNVTLPLIWKLALTPGAPSAGWPPPTNTL